VAKPTIKLLHVEDGAVPRRLVAHQLAAVPDWAFEVRYAAGEDEAVAAFGRGGADLVILDYHLEQGDGLSCLRRLRAADAVVPVLVVSGQTDPEVAADLLLAGADDYIAKHDLATGALPRAVRAALARLEGWRRYHPDAEHRGDPAPPEAGLDPQAALERLGGNAALLEEVAGILLEEFPRWLAELSAALGRGDAAALFSVAHLLRGSVSTLGPGAVFHAAGELEARARAGDLGAAAEALAALQTAARDRQPLLVSLAGGGRSAS
jgi:CheY-like chemotaxis protein